MIRSIPTALAALALLWTAAPWSAAQPAPSQLTSPTTVVVLPEDEGLWMMMTELKKPTARPKVGPNGKYDEAQVKAYQAAEQKRFVKLMTAGQEYLQKQPKGAHLEEVLDATLRAVVGLSQEPGPAADQALAMADRLIARDDLKPSMAAGAYYAHIAHAAAGLNQDQPAGPIYEDMAQWAQKFFERFPKAEEGPQLLGMIAMSAEGDAPDLARKIYKQLVDLQQPEISAQAAEALSRMEAIGKPMELAFTATDGSKVDLAALKGKVVLIDFWATWCGPCVEELPNVKRAYEKYHDQGFEIVGISFDKDRAALDRFVKKESMPWPQYFDGKGWENELGQRFGIRSIPAMWLLDREGKLVDLNAREGLERKIAALLEKGAAPPAQP